MRLHHLRIEAFGPFPGSESIDFDTLSGHGLHLIHGPTGAGKSTILDAICFALFGQVPGLRRGHRESLRSDHAAPGAVPKVSLEVTVGGRRLHIERTPEHLAPKKRGDGMTRRQAKVVLQERVDGRWTAVSTRLDEVGDAVEQALGMGLEQFAQVVLLPQGQFAAFLQAKPEDRGAVLRRLFDVQRFADLEDWVAARRRTLTAAAVDARQRVREELRVLESVLSDLPHRDEDAPPWSELATDALPAALEQELRRASAGADAAMATAERAESDAERAREQLSAARRLQALQAQALSARAVLADHDARAAWAQEHQHELTRARRAAAVEPSRRTAARAADERDRADVAMQASEESLRTVAPHLSSDDDGQWEALAAAGELLRAARPAAQEVEEARRLATSSADAVRRLEAERAEIGTELARLQEILTGLEREHEVLAEQAVTVDSARHRRSAVERVHLAREAWTQAGSAAEQAGTAVRVAGGRFATAEKDVLRMRSLRLEHVAASLALDLRRGQPCPVCGAEEHPAPASLPLIDLSAETIDAAEAASELAGAALREATARQAGAESALTAARERLERDWRELGADDDLPSAAHVARLLEEASSAVGAAQRSAAELASIIDRIATGQRALTGTDARREQVDQQVAVRRAEHDAALARRSELDRRLRELLDEHGGSCPCVRHAPDPADDESEPWTTGLRDAEAAHAAVVRAVERARAARTTADALTAAADRAHADLTALVDEHGFETVEDAHRAWRDQSRRDTLEEQLRRHHAGRERALAVLDQPEVRTAEQQEPPALDDLGAATDTAVARARAARSVMATSQRAAGRLGDVARDLLDAIRAGQPVETELESVAALADTMNGGGDNVRRMRLSSYVLAARLEEVTRLANERLGTMTDGRYELAHSDARAKGGLRSGLGLVVHDAWTGRTRDTATLSGGEAFLASLALALGLGEAVRQESGGIELETLFVDEGFGSLDEQSLEQVMQVLDTLRAGGRSVGIVSHVAELRQRVPARIAVSKTESGSTVSVHVGGESAA
ncbi:AAA family ATPase [Luteipulveratus flavus]|uniref:Nuclease SbcCD subunit C n=1 Tax=Luteipulveratus flavus TaxID=3031728 RepID=A0ABT6CD94_9MICO|nr:SMC family ATPase [Luteipulveratus sp. YIM 133296]MDF8266247.1 SMC family ATPase [Luteipulveratus sp. YIM 133296]